MLLKKGKPLVVMSYADAVTVEWELVASIEWQSCPGLGDLKIKIKMMAYPGSHHVFAALGCLRKTAARCQAGILVKHSFGREYLHHLKRLELTSLTLWTNPDIAF